MVDTQVRIVNKNGKDVAKNNKEVGKIIVKGKSIIANDSDESIHDGWVQTGDLGTMDSKGKIHVVKRKNDIHSNEDELSTVTIEKILANHEAVQEVSVIPQPDETVGEIPHGFVVLTPDHLVTKLELIDYTKQELSSDNLAIEITIMEELPKTFSGKILKNQLG